MSLAKQFAVYSFLICIINPFKIADRNNNRSLDREEFAIACKNFGTGLDATETNIIFDHFDSDRSGHINYDEYVYALAVRINFILLFSIFEREK